MKMKFSKLTLALGSALLCLTTAYASGIPNNDNPTTFLGPTLKGKFTNTITDNTAFSVLGEAGLRNFRVGATFGWKIDNNQRFKISADYLYQRITYSFFSGDVDRWVNQGSVGAAYLYEFDGYSFNPALGLNAYYSHAPSDTLHTVVGTFISKGKLMHFVDQRRIAGSNAGGLSPMFYFMPWDGANIGLELNYDDVRYDRNNSGGDNATGLGGTFRINQMINQDVGIGASAAVRKPFNNYAAYLNWSNVPYFGREWTIGLDGDYTVGKEQLPNSYNVSLGLNYALDQRCPLIVMERSNLKGDVKDEKGERPVATPIVDDLMAWTADPAVYLPQVLAVTDEKVKLDPCTPVPTLIGVIGNQTFGPGTFNFPTAQAFSPSTGLTYSISVTPTPTGGNSVTINPTTGVVTVVDNGIVGQSFTAVVTARNACGAVATSNAITITVDPRVG